MSDQAVKAKAITAKTQVHQLKLKLTKLMENVVDKVSGRGGGEEELEPLLGRYTRQKNDGDDILQRVDAAVARLGDTPASAERETLLRRIEEVKGDLREIVEMARKNHEVKSDGERKLAAAKKERQEKKDEAMALEASLDQGPRAPTVDPTTIEMELAMLSTRMENIIQVIQEALRRQQDLTLEQFVVGTKWLQCTNEDSEDLGRRWAQLSKQGFEEDAAARAASAAEVETQLTASRAAEAAKATRLTAATAGLTDAAKNNVISKTREMQGSLAADSAKAKMAHVERQISLQVTQRGELDTDGRLGSMSPEDRRRVLEQRHATVREIRRLLPSLLPGSDDAMTQEAQLLTIRIECEKLQAFEELTEAVTRNQTELAGLEAALKVAETDARESSFSVRTAGPAWRAATEEYEAAAREAAAARFQTESLEHLHSMLTAPAVPERRAEQEKIEAQRAKARAGAQEAKKQRNSIKMKLSEESRTIEAQQQLARRLREEEAVIRERLVTATGASFAEKKDNITHLNRLETLASRCNDLDSQIDRLEDELRACQREEQEIQASHEDLLQEGQDLADQLPAQTETETADGELDVVLNEILPSWKEDVLALCRVLSAFLRK